MANYFYLTLDTTAPSNPSVVIAGGATYTTDQLVNLTVSTTDGSTTGYQMKVWGNVDVSHDANVQATEAASSWVTYAPSKQVRLASGDGNKTVSIKIRDDVYNESSIVSDSITLDTTLPVANTGAPDVTKVSKVSGKNTVNFTFSGDVVFTEYKVKLVSSTSAGHDTGVLIGTTAGSVNTSGTGTFSGPVSVSLRGTDIEAASSGDGQKIIKVFIKSQSGLWSA